MKNNYDNVIPVVIQQLIENVSWAIATGILEEYRKVIRAAC